ncbi:MAG: TonB-dependent receptor [Rhizomicrobium sp.]
MANFIAAACAAAVLTAAAASAAHADTAASNGTETVVVSATRAPIRATDVPESVSVLSVADVLATPVKSLDGLLRQTPSVNLPAMASYEIFPTSDTVSMRGLGGSRALVLLDGVPLNDPFFGYVQWNQIPVADVSRVEVVRGGGATLWGNYAMGGVIDVVTRVPDRDTFSLDAAGGGYGTLRANGYAALAVSDDLRIGLDAGTLRTDGYNATAPASRVPLTVNNRFQAGNVQATADFTADPTLSGHVRAAYHETSEMLHQTANTAGQENWTLSGDLVKDFGASNLTGTFFHVYSFLRIDNAGTPAGGVTGVDQFVQNRHFTPATTDGGSLVWAMPGTDWLKLVSLGVDYQGLHGKDTGLIFATSGSGAVTRTDRALGSQRFAGVFAQAEVVPLSGLDVLGSARYQYFENYGGFDGSPGGAGVVPSTSASSFDPRLSVRYDLTPVLSLRAAGYQAFHAPPINSLYRSFSNGFTSVKSNPNLKPETLSGGEAGFDINLPELHGQVTYYYNVVNDLLATRPLTHAELPPGYTFGTFAINAGTAHAQGVEAQLDWTPLDGLDARLGYAYAKSIVIKNPADPASIGKQLGGVPRHVGSLALIYTGSSGWTLAGNMFWRSDSWSDNDHKLPVGSQFVFGLSASYPISENAEPYLQIENLFDERHIANNAGTSAPELETPFTVLAGIRLKMN